MKKILAVVVFLFAVAVTDTFGQTVVSPRTFATYYGFKNGNIDFENEYTLDLEDKDDKVFGSIEGNLGIIDTAKEWFLAMACGTSQIKVTDVSMAAKIEAVLPSKDKQKRGLQAGFVVYQDLVIAKFLGNTDARSKYEGWLKFICDNNGVKPEEVEAFYRNGIRKLVSDIVDEEFKKTRGGYVPYNVYVNNGHREIIEGIKDIITAFYLNPNTNTYTSVQISLLHFLDQMKRGFSFAGYVFDAYADTIRELTPALMDKINIDGNNVATSASVQNDPTVKKVTQNVTLKF
jgi:hypothetical protein